MESGGYEMVHIKRENEDDTFDEGFDRSGVKYEPCQSGMYDGTGSENIDQINAFSNNEEQKDEKYVAVELNVEDADFADSSTIQYKAEHVKSEFDCDIQIEDVKIEFFENVPGKCRKKVFQCKICSKAFTRSGNLKIHERIHTGEKPFSCKICSKAFTQLSNLKIHEMIHTGERPFHCKICFKTFIDSGNLKIHERIHTGEKPFHCKVCSKAFTQSTGLKSHEWIHTGERPFHCKICFKTFIGSSNLKVHERIHTGEKPFHCKVCSKAFTNSGNLKKHEIIHTGQK